MKTYTSTKQYNNLPCAHRQHGHKGHCRFIHGYSRKIKFYFQCNQLDENHHVVDFSDLKDLKAWLDHMFDHTMLINEDDPERELFELMHERGICDLRIIPNVSMEGSAKMVFDYADKLVRKKTSGRAWCVKVEVHENDKNSAEYSISAALPL